MIAEIHSAVGLVLDHARFAAMHTDEAEAAQQMQAFRQQRPQPLLHAQTVLQQQNLGSRRRRCADQGCQFVIAGGLGAHQQPVAGRHVLRRMVGLDRRQAPEAMHRTIQAESGAIDRLELAAQEKMHVVTGMRQHQSIEAADGSRTDDADPLLL